MKKLLSLSILAATLVSTAVFAGPNSPSPDKKDVILASHQASGPTIEALIIAQTLSDSLSRGQNHAKAIKIDLDNQGHFSKGTLVLANNLMSSDHDAVQVALMSAARSANKNLGYKAVVVETGNGSTLATITAIDQRQSDDKVRAYAVETVRNQVTFSEVAAKKAVVDQLTDSKDKARLVAVAELTN